MSENQTTPTENNFESTLRQAVFNNGYEKTNYDKTLSKDEVFRLREIVRKEVFNIADIQECQNILVSTEVKLTNFDDWDRYIVGKYYIWLSEFAKRYSKSLRAKKFYDEITSELSDRTKKARIEIEKEYAETYKLMVHVYCYLIRSPLSIGGTLINRFTTQRQEIEYKGSLPIQPAPQAQQVWRG